jgi:gluconate kinase
MAKADKDLDDTTHPLTGRIIFVSGRQGSGKTALSNALAAAHGLVHLDGDAWSNRPEVKDSLTALCTHMIKYRGADPGSVEDDPGAWQPFYAGMCEAALKLNTPAAAPAGVIVSHSLFRRTHRNFVKEQLGAQGLLMVLEPPAMLALERAAKRCAEEYKALGKTVEEWIGMLEMNSAGFEPYDASTEGEAEALVLANETERSVEELLSSAEALLGLV